MVQFKIFSKKIDNVIRCNFFINFRVEFFGIHLAFCKIAGNSTDNAANLLITAAMHRYCRTFVEKRDDRWYFSEKRMYYSRYKTKKPPLISDKVVRVSVLKTFYQEYPIVVTELNKWINNRFNVVLWKLHHKFAKYLLSRN